MLPLGFAHLSLDPICAAGATYCVSRSSGVSPSEPGILKFNEAVYNGKTGIPPKAPHISTPVTLSIGPIVRHICLRKRSPEPTVE